ITVTVNGAEHRERVEPRMHAADFLRRVLGLTGTHVGCEQGVCGMCTVLLDGEAVKGCLLLAPQLDGRDVRTVESLATNGKLAPLQQAFKDAHGLQCGFCTPGFLMTATALAESGRRLDRDQIRDEISGVLCRCTGYEGIVNAIDTVLNGEGGAVAAEEER
ncbi:MAG TPA: (2Fe-2S)-binding protein, partial [Solirubrobacterales bacterium]|nr:(2Fe-2S)-binding protein [Solirubrobacterales bacterium]